MEETGHTRFIGAYEAQNYCPDSRFDIQHTL